MKKAADTIQSIVGLTAIGSFLAIFVSMFIARDYMALFAVLFFLLFPISLSLNIITREWRISFGFALILLLFVVLGITTAYFGLDQLKSFSIYTLDLQRVENGFSGSFIVPQDIALKNKHHTYLYNMSYYSSWRLNGKSANIEFTFPGGEFKNKYDFGRSDGDANKNKQTLVHTRWLSGNDFVPKDGLYSFKLFFDNKELAGEVSSVDVEIREYRR
ncbi:MAG: hypothetical protein A3C81_03165 [Candidatus Yanofskybacteria bacterium RIFCSPHIGHO2_02_FULL_46_19]|uniref:DUF1616 domain-containing protein n=1 Tax=Candidatus Yanofskybacteria bacterium RIFCSPHIGHO2_02_FULL_46_19 TaxID=1802684 RepID=A0A1F8FUW2_9BACT|nr:MAG: hypothetical protein A3C81_03165 [Candidatus Yanofskybacteria bacterium RIFCSPHIGHO2_02_FULL_46_19]